MLYIKLNEDGSVEQFPFYLRDPLRPNAELPAGVVEVDAQTNRPTVSWDQIIVLDSYEEVDGQYLATYTVANRFTDLDDKRKGAEVLKRQYEGTNERSFKHKAKAIKAAYPDAESESWPIQRAEALAYDADPTVATPLLQSIADSRGITLAEQVTKVLENVVAFDAEFGALLGKYQKNKSILTSIDLEDENTWDLLDTVERL